MIERPKHCIQCGWTIAPRRYDDVYRNGELVPLHKGGCPAPAVVAVKLQQ